MPPLAHPLTTLLTICGAIALLAGPTIPRPALAQPAITLQIVATGFDRPILATHAGDTTQRLFIAQQRGRIRILNPATGAIPPNDFLDLTAQVSQTGNERGLLGLAFHPAYTQNRQFYVCYTRAADGATLIVRYLARADDPNLADPTSAQVILGPIAQPFENHNGGHIAFGPDGHLYIGLGDGGSANDPQNNAQNPANLLGAILRIDVDTASPYAIPPTNPFATHPTNRPEIYAYGLRNPWRWSFDRQTGLLWCADVGQTEREEINIIQNGANYGWRILEGTRCTQLDPAGCARPDLAPPIHEYTHTGGRCSITGGHVYRGARYPALRGHYLFADYCTGEIFSIDTATGPPYTASRIHDHTAPIASFGEGEDGELYICELKTAGSILRILGPSPEIYGNSYIIY